MAKRYKEPEIQNKQEKNISPEIYVNKKGDDFMENNNKKDYAKSNSLRNGNKSQGQYGKTSFNNTIEQPGINESGIEAKKRGF